MLLLPSDRLMRFIDALICLRSKQLRFVKKAGFQRLDDCDVFPGGTPYRRFFQLSDCLDFRGADM
jgi:hypothetical protein